MRLRPLFVFLFLVMLSAAPVGAGPYPPPAEEEGTTAVFKDDPAFGSWASGYKEPVDYGDSVDPEWMTPLKTLGMATGRISDICSLGRGGSITLTFDPPIPNRDGWDFAVFENGLSDTFLELAYVEVSSDGSNFVRFDCYSLTPGPVGTYGSVDTTNIDGFGGKYRIGYGTPFDLEMLSGKTEVMDKLVNIDAITHIRIVDMVGDGNEYDDDDPANPIYDPYPTTGSAGFDLEAVGVLISDPTVPWPVQEGNAASGGCFIATAAFGSAMEPHVVTLRKFRDAYLLTNRAGSVFVRFYYRQSPPAAAFIADRAALRAAVRAGLFPLILSSSLMLRTSQVQKTLFLSALLVLPACCMFLRMRFRKRKKGICTTVFH